MAVLKGTVERLLAQLVYETTISVNEYMKDHIFELRRKI